MLGIGLSRATGGSRTTGMVFLLKEYTFVVWIGLESCMCGFPFKVDAVACSDEKFISCA